MSYRVLIPIDDSDPSQDALDYVISQHRGDEINALHVLDPGEFAAYGGMDGGMMANFEEIQEYRREEATKLLQEFQELAAADGVEISTEIATGSPARTILEHVEDNDFDHVVIGSHGRTGAGRVLLGSVAETVARRSPVPVTIIR